MRANSNSNNKPELKIIAVDKLFRGRYQPRKDFDPEALEELAQSIKTTGLIQPIVVRPANNHQFEIVAGERRWRAAQIAGLQAIECLVNQYTDEQTAAVTTIENINRVNLNPIEEAEAYQKLIEEFGYLHEELAAIVGKSRVKITNVLRLLKLDPRVKALLSAGTLSEGHGKVLAGISWNYQYELAKECVEKGWNVRRIEMEAKKKLVQENKLENEALDPNLRHLEVALSEYVGCKVAIDFQQRKGQLKIDFQNLEILEGIIQKLGFKPD